MDDDGVARPDAARGGRAGGGNRTIVHGKRRAGVHDRKGNPDQRLTVSVPRVDLVRDEIAVRINEADVGTVLCAVVVAESCRRVRGESHKNRKVGECRARVSRHGESGVAGMRMHRSVDRRRIDVEIVLGKYADVRSSAWSQIGDANGNYRTCRDIGHRGDGLRSIKSRRAVRNLVRKTRRRCTVANGDKAHLHDSRRRTIRRAEHADLGFWPCGSKSDDQHAAAAGATVIGTRIVAATTATAEPVHASFSVELRLRAGDSCRLVAVTHAVSTPANAAGAGIVVVTAAAAAAGVVDLLAGDIACLAGASSSVRSGVLVTGAISAWTACAASSAAFGTAGKALAFSAGTTDTGSVGAAAAASACRTGDT